MILTFARLQRISTLERPSAIKRWLQKRAIAYLTDAAGQPFTTLDAINRRLQHAKNVEGEVPNYGAAYRLRAERERETAERRAAARLLKETAKQQRNSSRGLPKS